MTAMKLFRVAVLLFTVLGAASSSAFAWGREGHRIVARVAAKNLTPEARQKVAAIFGTSSSAAAVEDAMAKAATWPDEIDKKATGSSDWHFIDGPVRTPFTLTGLCPSNNCVTARIAEMQQRLQLNQTGFHLLTTPSPNRPMTSQELAFLIHFVGDVHQPLHAASDGDRGGNCVPLKNPIQHAQGGATTELHAVWDDDIVDDVMSRLGNESATANALSARASHTTIVQGMPNDWAKESNDLARSAIYTALSIQPHPQPAQPGKCPVSPLPKVDVTKAYLDANEGAGEDRLMRAGIRLANLLNQICAANGCKIPAAHRRES
jgi:hypothetical protein